MSPARARGRGRVAGRRRMSWRDGLVGVCAALVVLWVERGPASRPAPTGRGQLVVTVEGLSDAELEALFAPLEPRGVAFTDLRVASTDPLDGLVSLWTGLHPTAHAARTRGVPRHALRPAASEPFGEFAAVPEGLPAPLFEGLGFFRARSPEGALLERLSGDGAAARLAAVLAQDLRDEELDLAEFALWGHLELEAAAPAAREAVRDALVEAVQAHRSIAPRGTVLLVGVGRRIAAGSTPSGPEGWLAEGLTRQRALLIAPEDGPGSGRPGARVERTVGTVDLTATLAELRGLERPELQGRSLVRDLEGRLAWAGPVWVETPAESGGWAALHWGPDRLVASRSAPGQVLLQRLGPAGFGPNRADDELELAVRLSQAMLALDAENRARAAAR